jgi:hypothetical protein
VDANASSKPTAVAVSAFATANINNLCQSVTTDLSSVTGGLLGNYTLTLKANSAKATDMIIDMQSLKATEADFTNMNIGQDASTINNSATGADNQKNLVGNFAQTADGAVLTNVQQVANATSAGSFDLSGMSLGLSSGTGGCIPAS